MRNLILLREQREFQGKLMQRLESIQFLRGLAAFAVLLFHICTLSNDYSGGVFFAPFVSIGNAGVDLFFVISGFVMVATTYEKFDVPSTATRFAVHRLSRIYPPYWILSGALLLYYIYNPAGVNSKQGGADLAASFLLTPSPLLPLLPVAWTLMHEVLFYFVFFIAICFLPRKNLGRALAMWAAAVFLKIATDWSDSGFKLNTLLLHPFNLEFISGALIGLLYKRRGPFSMRISTLFLSTGLVLFFAAGVFLQTSKDVDLNAAPLRVFLFGIPSLFLFAGCFSINFRRNGLQGILTRMGDYSYSLYLTHILLIHLAYRLITKKLNITLTFQSNGVLALFLIFLCIFSGWMFFIFIEKSSCAIFLRFIENLLRVKGRILGDHSKSMNPNVRQGQVGGKSGQR
ncbi:acyltransferase family protein [Variovorax boronicumulans]|uniref:acyltransferase family protein n=1 Tax=Variovorax boronicumulans TaxID=436515 RepID=UPI0027D7B992|nr:acyltransferase [Variovorax boronicumulans]